MTEQSLDSLVEELESVAGRLRSEELDAQAGAELVERCAELAALLGAELERQGRAARVDPGDSSGQERLL